MVRHSLCFFFFFLLPLLHILPQTATAATEPAYIPTDLILLDCGASLNSKDTSGRNWAGEVGIKFLPSNAINISSISKASYMDPSVSATPYETARVFPSLFTYTFPLSAGPKFLRLYFYPQTYSGLDTSASYFSLTANSFTLLRNFSAFLNRDPHNPSFMKEFVINIGENQTLDLTFFPNPNSFAFVNGIGVVSVPDALYFQGNDVPIKFVNAVFENLYRLNVGGSYVPIEDDSMIRAWSPDDDYIYGGDYGYTPHIEGLPIMYTSKTPPYTAQPIVYVTARVTGNYSTSLQWAFPVDSGFYYILRLHFCEIMQEITKQNDRVFTIYINDEIAEREADVILWTVTNATPIFKDYMTWVADDGRRGKQDLRLSLKPFAESKPKYLSALLNGLEIFKLSVSERSLAVANPTAVMNSPPPTGAVLNPPQKKKSRGSSMIYSVTGSVVGVLAVVGLGVFSFFILQRRRRKRMEPSTYSSLPLSNASSSTTTRGTGSGILLHSEFCRCFSFDEIKTATCNFDRNFIIGKGGFGYVYRGIIDSGATTVAIKRLNQSSNQGAHEFLTEIQMLSKLRHLHLVSLIGCCDELGEMILVYDYMDHGSLRDHLYKSENSPLSWNQRLQICMGAAKGLNYLHTGAEHAIIHRDVKSTNILLDENWVAKISDFGLSKMGNTNDSFTHISTNVKGTFGYLDPKYLSSHQLTRKSDVYAFGVVLFEIISGRPAVDVSLDEEQHSLAGWARYCVREGEVDQLIDPSLMGQISTACLEVYIGIAGRCIHIQPLERPTMADVVVGLQLALTLQHTTDSAEQKEEDDNDHSNGVISLDGMTATVEYNPSSSTRNSQIEGY